MINNLNSNNQFRENINGYIKIKEIVTKNYKVFSVWYIKSLSSNDIKIIIEDSLEESSIENHNLIPKSTDPFISMITLDLLISIPTSESYIDLELSNNLYGRKFDSETLMT